MLLLSNSIPFDAGEDRIVYQHPEKPDRCIKIARTSVSTGRLPTGIRDRLFYLSRGCRAEFFDQNFLDETYARELEQRNDPDVFRHLPRCYGWLETDRGPGVVWEMIVDFDGSPCASLKDCYYSSEILGERQNEILWHALDDFFSWQLRSCVLLREMAYSNTLVRRLENLSVRLYHVDAIGCADLVPLASSARWFARLRILSKIRRFRRRMNQWLGPPPAAN